MKYTFSILYDTDTCTANSFYSDSNGINAHYSCKDSDIDRAMRSISINLIKQIAKSNTSNDKKTSSNKNDNMLCFNKKNYKTVDNTVKSFYKYI